MSLKTTCLSSYSNFTRVWYIKTKRGKVSRLAREQYLRDDIQCEVFECTRCNSTAERSNSFQEYIIPDINVTIQFLELLESPEISHLLFCKTVTNEASNIFIGSYEVIRYKTDHFVCTTG